MLCARRAFPQPWHGSTMAHHSHRRTWPQMQCSRSVRLCIRECVHRVLSAAAKLGRPGDAKRNKLHAGEPTHRRMLAGTLCCPSARRWQVHKAVAAAAFRAASHILRRAPRGISVHHCSACWHHVRRESHLGMPLSAQRIRCVLTISVTALAGRSGPHVLRAGTMQLSTFGR